MNKKVLIIAYYWPPSGGAGVQRWLKFTHYLQELGIDVHVIVPDSKYASYYIEDPSLTSDIHPKVKVYRTKTIEPFNIYHRLFGKKNNPGAGFSNADPSNKKQQLAIFIRTNFFIPDPRKYWKQYALKKAKEVIKKEGIQTVITTSPPPSVQLIGLELKKQLNVRWIADLRDLWTDIFYYKALKHTSYSKNKDANYERQVVEHCDNLVTVSPVFAKTYHSKSPSQDIEKFKFIPNGYDTKDFEEFEYNKETEFIISYTGSISQEYKTEPFVQAIYQFKANNPSKKIKVRLVGSVHPMLQDQITDLELNDVVKYIDYVPHHESIKYLEDSYALLLIGPLNESEKEGSLPAKVFEYMAASRPIIYIGQEDGFMSKILLETNSGKGFNTTETVLAQIENLYTQWEDKKWHSPPSSQIEQFSRLNEAKQYADLI